NLPPVAVCQNDTGYADANCEATVSVDNGSYDPEGGSVTLTQNPPGPYTLGDTPVWLIVTDSVGAEDSCQATVTVIDTTPPVVSCPNDTTVDNDPGACGAIVNYSPGMSDNCPGGVVTANPPSGSLLPVGTTSVEVIATDNAGLVDTCFFDVTVNDTEHPVITCPDSVVVLNDPGQCGAVVTLTGSATVTDNCDNASITYTPPSGSAFPVGTTLVMAVATDLALLQDTCFFDVKVYDTEPPTVNCPPDTTILINPPDTSAIVNYTVTAGDNCQVDTIITNPPSGSEFLMGTTPVECIATDDAGNADTCYFNVTVTEQLNPDFDVSAVPDTLYATTGIATPLYYLVTVTSIDGFIDPVTLSVSGLPLGVTLDFLQNPVIPTDTSGLNGTTGTNTPIGTYPLLISGSVPVTKQNHSDTVYLVVEPCTEPPIIGLSQDWFDVTITEGEGADSLVVFITNEASCGMLSWIAASDSTWVVPVPDNGSVMAGETPGSRMAIALNTASMLAGDYVAYVDVMEAFKSIIAGITINLHILPPSVSADSVWVEQGVVGYPGMDVAVELTFRNDELLAGMSAGLTWTSADLFLDSVSYFGSRVDYVTTKVTVIDSISRTVALGALVIPPEAQVPIGKGLWSTLWFSVDPAAAAATVTIDTTFILLGVELIFSDSLANAIYPQFVAGSVIIDTMPPMIAGVVEDELGYPIAGAGVELYDQFPGPTHPLQSTTSGPDGSFSFNVPVAAGKLGEINTVTAEESATYVVRAYKAGYYPGTAETGFPNINVVVSLANNGGTVMPTFEWVDLYCDSSEFDDMPLPLGTVIEAYDPQGVLCGQWNVFEVGRYGFMPVYRDDQYTTGIDEGCLPGDQITIKVNGFEVLTQNDPVIWGVNGDRYETCFFGYSIIKICIPLNQGWNLISWNVDTEIDSIEVLAADVMHNVDVILSFEQMGLTYDPSLPQFSTLFEGDHFHGFWFRMNAADTICVEGTFVDPSTPIALEQNWNLVSYLPDQCLLIEDALASIWTYVQVVLGFDGGALTYDMTNPSLATLFELCPTFGYWIKTTMACSLIYPGAVPLCASAPADATFTKESYIPEIVISNTWINLYGSGVAVNDGPLETGTVIQAHTESGVLVGEWTVASQGQFGFMPVYGADQYASGATGAQVGETVTLSVNGVAAEETITWTGNGDRIKIDKFTLTATAADDQGNLPIVYSLSQNYPNPFNPETSISYAIAKAGMIELSVYNVLGIRINTLVSEYQAEGEYTVKWYGDTESGAPVASGVYFYKLKAGDYTDTRKMMLLK
ncbi:MAG: HYR domain-containing protein, partial [candidate division Zixibacteria bacterium]|nr:HYR domain-containing protein [candidate division Zixibacteria bacterium]